MKIFFSILIFLPCTAFGQAVTCKVIDDKTRQPVSAATILNGAGEVVTFSNEDGVFEIRQPADSTKLSITCLGYSTCVLPGGSPSRDTVIKLKPLVYTLPPVFVGDYAGNLIRAAFKKADSANGKYFYAKGFEMEFEWVNNKPADCYEFLQNEKISVEGLVARGVIAARHGIIPANAGDFSIDQYRSFSEFHNWYDKSFNLKKFFRDYNLQVIKLIRWDTAEVAQIRVTMKKSPKRYDGYSDFYINTGTHDMLRYEVTFEMPYISILGIAKIYDLQSHFEQNYSPEIPFAALANSSISMSLICTNHSGSERDTLRFYEKAYHTQLVPWTDGDAFKPTPFHIKNGRAYQKFGNNKWDTDLPVKLSDFENNFLRQMERAGAF